MTKRNMDQNHEARRAKYDSIHYVHAVPKWRVLTGALIGAAISAGMEIIWRGLSVNWDFLSDRAQELIILEIVTASMVIGGAFGATACLIRNQLKGAKDKDD